MKVILAYFVLTSYSGPKSKQTTNGIANIQCHGKVEVPEIFDSPQSQSITTEHGLLNSSKQCHIYGLPISFEHPSNLQIFYRCFLLC